MPTHISNASANGQQAQPKVKSQQRAAGGINQGFFEKFQKLPDSRFRDSSSGLKVAVVKEGSGTSATNGQRIKVRYTGWLLDGSKFDSSNDRGRPFEVTLGTGRVIKGWEEGLKGIKPGERRQLIIPPSLGYGKRQVGTIPPGSTLIFNVEAIAVDSPPANPKGTRTVVA
ncbi:MAG: FKBP-type peptidyl-prolyl cis-trans isomerase [SAR324 cluster bacterium]|nr:FKBP-type peptidyl-prolyl cis-trans isomerase [SAR324 cluster bacterium]